MVNALSLDYESPEELTEPTLEMFNKSSEPNVVGEEENA